MSFSGAFAPKYDPDPGTSRFIQASEALLCSVPVFKGGSTGS